MDKCFICNIDVYESSSGVVLMGEKGNEILKRQVFKDRTKNFSSFKFT